MVEVIPTVEEAENLPKFGRTTVQEFEKFTKELEEETVQKLRKEVKTQG